VYLVGDGSVQVAHASSNHVQYEPKYGARSSRWAADRTNVAGFLGLRESEQVTASAASSELS
jgi:hypothetical protein